ncbi:hypothetical protein Tco_0860952 [Tanacetum coccineum]|uniref:Uncharacterized protein n=1 Tax=Tanacetum coccineum TaxID=301880 RepID=A0ABQ5BGD6_9ASTR
MDVDNEISNLVDLHMGMFGGGWKWQDLQGLLWLDEYAYNKMNPGSAGAIEEGHRQPKAKAPAYRSELMGYVDDSEMPMYCRGRGGSVGSNSGVGERKVEFMGGIGCGSFAKRSMVAKDGLGGDGFVIDGGRSSSKLRKDGEDGGVENKTSMGSRLIATGEFIIEDSGGVIIGEVGIVKRGSDINKKQNKPSQNDKTEHGMEKTVPNQARVPKMTKSETDTENQQSNRAVN